MYYLEYKFGMSPQIKIIGTTVKIFKAEQRHIIKGHII